MRSVFYFILGVVVVYLLSSCSEDSSSPTENSDSNYRVVKEIRRNYNQDSEIWMLNSERTISYDAYNRIKNDRNYYDSDSYFTNKGFTYDNNSVVIPKGMEYFDGEDDYFSNVSLSYEDGKIKEAIGSQDDGTGVLEETLKSIFTYDGDLLTRSVQYYKYNGSWIKEFERNWLYLDGRLSEYIINWVEEDEKDKYLYTWENDKLIGMTHYVWSSSWEKIYKNVYSYADGKVAEKKEYIIYQGDWVLNNKSIYQYDNEYLSSIRTYSEIGSGKSKVSFSYDSKWNYTGFINYIWNEDDNGYIPSIKQEIVYEEGKGNYEDINKVLYPEYYYTGLNDVDPDPRVEDEYYKNKGKNLFSSDRK
ncbi:MAG: hypothetical protein CR982_04345 [Candidatus Cloacimonadota bacterium]|nr:MAG: hypothetical protein CR982_04345 [Candidatus Cloacimonadota bacterium]PIE78854.1 MAG: hypothetical protein CSA15_05735 [Candidatus Delongbacteria bacterium]